MTTNRRLAPRTDANEKNIVATLRVIPGVTVLTGMNDILVGYKGKNFYYEIKGLEHVSKKTGGIRESAKKDSQKRLEKEWQGHYRIVWNLDQILIDLGIPAY